MSAMVEHLGVVEWQAAYLCLTALLNEYEPNQAEWATICEARRLVEFEVRYQFGQSAWRELSKDE